MSPDSIGAHVGDPQTLNKYSYVANNPLGRVDPDGHDWADGMSGHDSSHSGPGSLLSAMQADMGHMHDNGAWLDSEGFDPFQYTYEGKNYATFGDWASYLISTPGAYQEVTAQFDAYTKSIQYGKVMKDYMTAYNVTPEEAKRDISEDGAQKEGGHWNFPYLGTVPRQADGELRVPGSTLHFPTNDNHHGAFVHDDTVNPKPYWHVWNLAAHGLIDYVGGHTIFSEGFTF